MRLFGLNIKSIFWLALASILLVSCFQETHTLEEMKEYEGPVSEIDSIETIYSDSASKRMRITGPKQIELQNGNREFPNGIKVEFYDSKEWVSSVLTANFARYMKDANLYYVRGNVYIQNFKENNKMKTEELYWNPVRHEIQTDKYVNIETPTDVLDGTGMTANEDFSNYKILKPSGKFIIK